MLRNTYIAGLFISLGCLAPAIGHSAYPEKPIRLIIPFAPGGSTDILGRILAEEMSNRLGQAVIVENKAGAAGNIGGSYVARATPDGYTLLMAAAGPTVINPSLYKDMSFNPAKDLAPITAFTREHNLLAIKASTPVQTLAEFIDYAKQQTRPMTFGSPGTGSPSHLAGELFSQVSAVNMTHIPYKGSGPAVVDLLAGHIDFMIDNMPPLIPYVQSGDLRAIAVPSPERSQALPQTPTFQESGLDGFIVMAWKGLMAPAGTPEAVIQKLHEVSADILKQEHIQVRLQEFGAEPEGNTPAQFAQQIEEETQWWAELITRTHTQIQ